MTEEAQKPAAAAVPEDVAPVVPDVPAVEKEAAAAVPGPEPEVAEKSSSAAVDPTQAAVEAAVEEEAGEGKEKTAEAGKGITQSVSFKEESYVVGELPESQKKALEELKALVQEALNKHEFTEVKKEEPEKKKEEEPAAEEEKKEEAAAEEKKEEATAEEKKEETEKTEAEPSVAAPAAEEEPKKEEEKAPELAATVPEPVPEPEAVVVAVIEEKVTIPIVDDDGAKTVEAIEETVVVAVEEPKAAEEAKSEEEPKKPEAEAKTAAEAEATPPPPPEEVEIYGIPLLADERSDVVLLKFLRARDFKVKDALTMLKNTVRWRKQFGIDAVLGEDIGSHLSGSVFSHGVDKEGHPVCYNVFGAFQNKELYQNTFGDEEKKSTFIKWRIQFLEKSIRKFDFDPKGISTIVQINDLKNSPGLFKREHNLVTKQVLNLLQDNYPEFVAKQVFINVPWWYLAFNRMISPFLTQRTKSKFVFAGPSKSAETLFKYIAPEQVPVQYGGLSRDGNMDFTTSDAVTEVTVKPASKHIVEIPVTGETGQVLWEIRVIGWDVTYGAEFVPSAEGHYTIILQKARKISPGDETVVSNSFKVTQPGKIVLTIDNQSSKKKLLLYRYKTVTE